MHVRGAPDSTRIGQQHRAQPNPGGAFQADNQRYFSKSEGCENARCDAAVLRGAQLFGAVPLRRTDPPHIGGSRQAGTHRRTSSQFPLPAAHFADGTKDGLVHSAGRWATVNAT